jgi:hypothetical protein
MAMANDAGGYQVLWPRGEKTIEVTALAPRLDSLDGKKVCQLWDYLFRGDEIFALLEEEMRARYPGIEFVSYEEFGSTHGEDETKILEELPARLKALGVDAVISGMGC